MRSYEEINKAYHDLVNEYTKPGQHPQNKAILKERLTVIQWLFNADSVDAELINDTLENKE